MFRIQLVRSHYDKLAIAAADLETVGDRHNDGPFVTDTGWCTKFDGGGNVHVPSDFVAIYGEASTWGADDGHEPVMYALVVCEDWSQDRNRGCRIFLRHKRMSLEVLLSRDGLNQVEGAYWSLWSNQDHLADDVNCDDWEEIAEEAVPEEARKVLQKCVEIVRGLYGQGGDFFEA